MEIKPREDARVMEISEMAAMFWLALVALTDYYYHEREVSRDRSCAERVNVARAREGENWQNNLRDLQHEQDMRRLAEDDRNYWRELADRRSRELLQSELRLSRIPRAAR